MLRMQYLSNTYMQIPLGVLLCNENKLEEMGQIVSKYIELVPLLSAVGHYVMPNSTLLDFDGTRFFSILFGGDQLIVARIREHKLSGPPPMTKPSIA